MLLCAAHASLQYVPLSEAGLQCSTAADACVPFAHLHRDAKDAANAAEKRGNMAGFYSNLLTKNVAYAGSRYGCCLHLTRSTLPEAKQTVYPLVIMSHGNKGMRAQHCSIAASGVCIL